MSNKIRCAIVGFGHIGEVFAQAINEKDNIELAAICDINAARRQKSREKYAAIPVYADFSEILNNSTIDAVFVLTPDSYHMDPFVKSLDAGKHVFVEKPVGNSIAEIQVMLAAVKRNAHLVTAAGHILRYYGINKKIKQMADAGEFGEIFYMEGDYIHNLIAQGDDDRFNSELGKNWYLEDEAPMVGGGCHPLDVLKWFVNEPIVSAYSAGNSIAFPAMKEHDCISSIFKFSSGCVAKVTALYGAAAPYAYCNNIAVYGTKASVWRDQVCYDHKQGWVPLQYEKYTEKHGHGFEREIANFVDAIKTGQAVVAPVTDCAESAIAAIMATESLKSAKEVAVPDLNLLMKEYKSA